MCFCSPHSANTLKLNVDGAAKGKPRPIGIGGAFTMVMAQCYQCFPSKKEVHFSGYFTTLRYILKF